VSHWTNGDYNNLIFRVDNSKSYTGRYGAIGKYLINSDRYLAKSFGTGFHVGDIRDSFPEWNIGNGKVIYATGLNWTFNQAKKSGGYIGRAGRTILQNLVNYSGDIDLSKGLVATDMRGEWSYTYKEDQCPDAGTVSGVTILKGTQNKLTHIFSKGKYITECEVQDISIDENISSYNLANDIKIFDEELTECKWIDVNNIECINVTWDGLLKLHKHI
jgi:hypothetical protein